MSRNRKIRLRIKLGILALVVVLIIPVTSYMQVNNMEYNKSALYGIMISLFVVNWLCTVKSEDINNQKLYKKITRYTLATTGITYIAVMIELFKFDNWAYFGLILIPVLAREIIIGIIFLKENKADIESEEKESICRNV